MESPDTLHLVQRGRGIISQDACFAGSSQQNCDPGATPTPSTSTPSISAPMQVMCCVFMCIVCVL